jgi:hypothetical protein
VGASVGGRRQHLEAGSLEHATGAEQVLSVGHEENPAGTERGERRPRPLGFLAGRPGGQRQDRRRRDPQLAGQRRPDRRLLGGARAERQAGEDQPRGQPASVQPDAVDRPSQGRVAQRAVGSHVGPQHHDGVGRLEAGRRGQPSGQPRRQRGEGEDEHDGEGRTTESLEHPAGSHQAGT